MAKSFFIDARDRDNVGRIEANIDGLLAAGLQMQEVDLVLRHHLKATRDILIIPIYGDKRGNLPPFEWGVFRDDGLPSLFKSVSYVACLEFALQQPMIEKAQS